MYGQGIMYVNDHNCGSREVCCLIVNIVYTKFEWIGKRL